MTIVGQAELDIRAVGAHFTSDIQTVVKPGMATTAAEGSKAAANVGKSFGVMWRSVSQSGQGALSPIADIVDHISSVSDEIHSKSLGLRATAVGAAGLGIGAGLQMLGSREQTAQAQLADAVSNTGHAYEEYGQQIEDTVKHGEHFGQNAADTLDILSTLTTASGSTKEALNRYQLVLDMAARRHIDATSAAKLLASAYAGNTRIFKLFGINVSDQTKAVAAATAADKAHVDATDKLKTARQNLKDVEARIADSRSKSATSTSSLLSAEASLKSAQASADSARFQHGSASPQYAAALARVSAAEARLTELRQKGTQQDGMSVSQQIELRKANEAVAAAEKNVTQTASDQTKAHKDAAGAAKGTDDIMNQLSKRLSGQASDAADTFTGHLKAIGATFEDDAAKIGTKYGPAITAVSTGILGLGTIMTGAQGIMARFRDRNAETAASEESVGTAATTAAGEVEAGTAEMAAASERNLRGRFVGAVGIAVGALGSFEVGKHSSSSTSATLGGAVTGLITGLAVGGPFGAAIGAAGGALVGLAGHFMETRSSVDKTKVALQEMESELANVLKLDKGVAGANVKGFINDYLKQHPDFTHQLAGAGVTSKDLFNYITTGAQSGKLAGLLNLASQDPQRVYDVDRDPATGRIMHKAQDDAEVRQINAAKEIVAMLEAFKAAMKEATDYLNVAGGRHHRRGHRAAGGPTYAGGAYLVGENGPELLTMGNTSGYVHPDVRGGDGSAMVAELRALRMDVLQVVHAARSTTRATEDVPHGVARALRGTGSRKFSSPSLATM